MPLRMASMSATRKGSRGTNASTSTTRYVGTSISVPRVINGVWTLSFTIRLTGTPEKVARLDPVMPIVAELSIEE